MSAPLPTVSVLPTCPHCTSDKRQHKAGCTPSKSHRYHCTACNRDYTAQPQQAGYAQETRRRAVALHLEGWSFRAVARLVGVNPQTVAKRSPTGLGSYKVVCNRPEPNPCPNRQTCQRTRSSWTRFMYLSGPDVVKKRTMYIATAVDWLHTCNRETRCLLSWQIVDERTFETMQPVIDQVPRTCARFYSDGLGTYATLIYC
jgi:transposase-like protein